MIPFHFSEIVNIEIQGPRVLELVERWPHYAEYNVIGFQNTVTIDDYRPNSLAALDAVLADDDHVNFAEIFSTVAQSTIAVTTPQKIHIELYPASRNDSQYTLWIAIGLQDHLPVLDYLLRKIEPFEDGGFAFIGLYQQTLVGHNHASSSSLSESSAVGGHDMTCSPSLWV